MHAEPVRPVRAVCLRLAPGVRSAIDVAQHRRRLRRKSRLDHDQVAPEVDDVVDVLDADRAFLLARAAGDAVPHDVVGHGVRHKWRWGPAQELIPKCHDQELRRELLAGIESWTHILAPAAFGAGHRVDHLLPGEVGGRGGPVPDLIVGRFEIDRLQAPAFPGAAKEDVDRGQEDVQVLRVGEVNEEAQDDQHVRPDRGALQV